MECSYIKYWVCDVVQQERGICFSEEEFMFLHTAFVSLQPGHARMDWIPY